MSNCARTERPYHSQWDSARADGHASGLSNDPRLSLWALMNVLQVVPALHHTLWDGAASNGTLSAGNGTLAMPPAPQCAEETSRRRATDAAKGR
jgi:hypothetical protein